MLVLAVLTAGALPVLASGAAAQDIGDRHNPDPLSALQAWLIYGGIVAGGFLVAIVFMLLSGRGGRAYRYRPGQPWTYDPVWFGPRPQVEEGRRPRAALPGAGGASGRW